MDFREYTKLTAKTESLHTESGKKFSKHERSIHMCIGLITEIGEVMDAYKKHLYYHQHLDLDNIKEEMGDIMWYCARLADIFSVSDLIIAKPSKSPPVVEKFSGTKGEQLGCMYNLMQVSMYLYEAVGNEKIVSNDDDRYVSYCINMIISYVDYILRQLGLELDDVTEANIKKLKIRYCGIFSCKKAGNRDLKAEKEAIKD